MYLQITGQYRRSRSSTRSTGGLLPVRLVVQAIFRLLAPASKYWRRPTVETVGRGNSTFRTRRSHSTPTRRLSIVRVVGFSRRDRAPARWAGAGGRSITLAMAVLPGT